MLDRIDWRELTTARICELTGVDESTARRYKRQRRAPPPVLRLLRLHLDGRVVPPSWPLSRFEGDWLRIDNEYYREGELRAWFWNRQIIHDQLSELRARVNRTLRPLDTPAPEPKARPTLKPAPPPAPEKVKEREDFYTRRFKRVSR